MDGFPQDPLDGVSMVYTFAGTGETGRKTVQYFENNGSRAIYQDGWYACTFGPLTPWQISNPAQLAAWDSNQDVWELYNLANDFSQSNDLAAQETHRLEAMKALFLEQARSNKVWPIGGGLWTRIHPTDSKTPPYTNWDFYPNINRMSEINGPGLGRQSNQVRIEVDVPANGTGVLYALGGASGGITLFMDQGKLNYEYNLMIIERYKVQTDQAIAPGRHLIDVNTIISEPRGPATVVISVDGVQVATTTVNRTNPSIFTASETFDVGIDLGSPVALDYFDRAPFAFNGVVQRIITSYPSAEEPTVLNWSRNLNGGLTLTVPAGMVLETSTNLADTWEVLPVAGTVEIIPDPAEKARFFRLRRTN